MDKSAEIEYNKDIISSSNIVKIIEEMGFEASLAENKSTSVRSALTVKDVISDSDVHKIESELQNQTGVQSVKVSLQENLVRIVHNSNKLNVNDLCKIISELGFSAEPVSLTEHNDSFTKINVEGMTCMSCVNNIEDFVGKKDGVSKIKVSLKDKVASIWFNSDVINPEDLRTIIDDMGFDASIQETTESENRVKCSLFEIQTLGVIPNEWTVEDEFSLFISKGVVGVETLSDKKTIKVHHFQDLTTANDIINTIQSMGFVCYEKDISSLQNTTVDSSPVINKSQSGSNEKSK